MVMIGIGSPVAGPTVSGGASVVAAATVSAVVAAVVAPGAFVFAVVAAGADVVSGDAFLSLPHDAAMRLNSAIADAIARLLRSRIILRTPLEVLDTRNLTSSG
jgi:hypothetical protein